MFIPEQTCSAAEVDTSPEMMVKFYKSLKEEYEHMTNDIMANMTCWCHSHHNMGVSPSGQDVKQFTEQITLAEKRGVALPQIMMIFNKKDQFYSRLWDPEENLMCVSIFQSILWTMTSLTLRSKLKLSLRRRKSLYLLYVEETLSTWPLPLGGNGRMRSFIPRKPHLRWG